VRLRWTRAASRDLERIETFISRDDPDAAIRVVLRVIDQVELLLEHAALGRPGRVDETRELTIVGLPYVVAYSVRRHEIIVLRVLHGAMKWPRRF
jgi:toxin ParE1/3/4